MTYSVSVSGLTSKEFHFTGILISFINSNKNRGLNSFTCEIRDDDSDSIDIYRTKHVTWLSDVGADRRGYYRGVIVGCG